MNNSIDCCRETINEIEWKTTTPETRIYCLLLFNAIGPRRVQDRTHMTKTSFRSCAPAVHRSAKLIISNTNVHRAYPFSVIFSHILFECHFGEKTCSVYQTLFYRQWVSTVYANLHASGRLQQFNNIHLGHMRRAIDTSIIKLQMNNR